MKINTLINNFKNHQIYLKVEEIINQFLQKKGYQKIDLPVLSPALIPESYLEVFETEFLYSWEKIHPAENSYKLYLTPSPELFLKRLLTSGIGSCYCMGKSFRNSEPSSDLHSFEFTMLEFYKIKADYMDVATELLEMLKFISANLGRKTEIVYQSKKISFNRWEKLSIAEAFFKYAAITEKELFNSRRFLEKAKKKKYKVNNFNYEDLFSQIYVQEIEPHLGKNGYPTLIYDYPKQFAALAKLNQDNKTAQRFEFYIEGIELGNCYTELTDKYEYERRFMIENNKRKVMGKINHPIDKGFIKALEYGLVECSGIAVGIERLAMIFADVDSIDKLKLIHIS